MKNNDTLILTYPQLNGHINNLFLIDTNLLHKCRALFSSVPKPFEICPGFMNAYSSRILGSDSYKHLTLKEKSSNIRNRHLKK